MSIIERLKLIELLWENWIVKLHLYEILFISNSLMKHIKITDSVNGASLTIKTIDMTFI